MDALDSTSGLGSYLLSVALMCPTHLHQQPVPSFFEAAQSQCQLGESSALTMTSYENSAFGVQCVNYCTEGGTTRYLGTTWVSVMLPLSPLRARLEH